jgi:hypothetical protein
MRRVAAGIDPVAHFILLLHLPQGAKNIMHLAGQLFRANLIRSQLCVTDARGAHRFGHLSRCTEWNRLA